MRSSLAISLTVHAAAFVALMYAPAIKLPEPGKSEYKQAIAGNETKLVWYKLNKELPEISSKPKKRPVRAETIAKQEIVASPKLAKKQTQIVWTPAPDLPAPAPVELPNLLAVKLPPVRQFVTPPDVQKPRIVPVEPLPDAPAIPLQVATAAVALPVPPKIVKRFVAPPKRVPPKLAEVVAPAEAPRMALNIPPADLDYKMKAPSRPFTAPPSKAVAAAPQPDLPDAPTDLNVAVVGLNPADKFVPLPIAPSPAQFSAAPQIRKEGAAAAGDTRGIALPDVSVRGARDLKATLLAEAYAAPTSARTMREAMRLAQPSGLSPGPSSIAPVRMDPIPAPRAAAMKVSGAPDARFNHRDVYMMAIQMPNLTSYSGHWLMWYAARSGLKADAEAIAAPVPLRKVDPKYIASAVADHVEGHVQLYCVIGREGTVRSIELLRGADDRLNRSAEEALSKWEFAPATRDGQPVDVDVVVEIPFTLAPPSLK
jgi:TonB family protein